MTNINNKIVQAGEISYALHSLGWKAFQNLCIAIVSEVWGQVVQSFADSKDGGRDGAFRGVWKTKEGELFSGNFTVQCKFTTKSDKCIGLSDLSEELIKARRLAKDGLAENYILLTNAKITGDAEAKMRKEFESIQGITRFAGYGGDRISQFIRESSRLRMLVPRVYGLGDLSQILDDRAYAQANEILSSLGDDLSKFVITEPYNQSAKALVEHGFVLLLGEPACGKSTIAASLSLGALDEWGCNTIKVRNADELVKFSNPHEPKQLFWVDDAFGPTQVDINAVIKWNGALPHIQAIIKRGARVIFTSRDYIYNSARNFLKETAFPLLRESQVVIRVENLKKEEKEQILYNHIRLGKQPRSFKTQIKIYLPQIASHNEFKPEIARRLGDPFFTKNLLVTDYGLNDFVSKPMDLLREIIRTLDGESRAALALIFIRNGILSSPIEIKKDERKFLELLNGTVGVIREALKALDGSLVKFQELKNGNKNWSFKHPTIRDAFASLVVEDKELMDIYLAGTPLDKIFAEVSCGSVEAEGAKVIVPASRFDALISRIKTLNFAKSEHKSELHYFLAGRCDREFLNKFLSELPDYINWLHVYSYLYAVSDVSVIVRLNEVGLLPEAKRLEAITRIRELAVETPDAGFLRNDIKSLFTDEEFEEILIHVQKELFPKLQETVDEWNDNFHRDDPDSYFGELEDALSTFRQTYKDRDEDIGEIDGALSRVEEVKAELRSKMPDEENKDDDYFGDSNKERHAESMRSIFDDVDE